MAWRSLLFHRPSCVGLQHVRGIFNIQNTFKIELAETTLSAASAERQAALEASVYSLRHGAKRLHPSNVLAAAVASPARFCIYNKHVLPSAFLLRFVKAQLRNDEGDGKVSF
jgi:hypothetical protein